MTFDHNSDPFDDTPSDGIKRDRWDRPLLLPAEQHPDGTCKQCDKMRKTGSADDGRHAYTRASTLASYIENDTHITRWKLRYLARGMAIHVDQAILAACETYHTGFGMPDRDPENAASGRRLDAIIDEVLGRMLINQKADYGTAVHVATEPDFFGFTRDEIAADVQSYVDTCKRLAIRIAGTEVFTANDTTMSAGTFDNLKWVDGYGWVITDKKTSSKVDSNHFAIQLAGYAHGEVYDPKTDTRQPLESLTGGERINRDVGLIFWIKNGRTEIHELDLVSGWQGAQIAAQARDYQKSKHPGRVDQKIEERVEKARATLAENLTAATNLGNLNALYRGYKHYWTDEHTAVAKARRAELEAS
jgi:hypothetical protein